MPPVRDGAPMTFAFLSPTSPDVVARSPMERQARAAGARFEVRDGWNVAVGYAAEARGGVTFADCSHICKYELQGELPPLELGRATVDGDSTWLPMTPTRALVLGGERPDGALDVTTGFAALRLAGPVARAPGGILCEARDRYLMLFGAAVGQYVWTVVEDAARHLGGGPAGA